MANHAVDVSKLMQATKDASTGRIDVVFDKALVRDTGLAVDKLIKTEEEIASICLNLWSLYRLTVAPRSAPTLTAAERKISGADSLKALQFYHLLEPTVPTETPKRNTDASKQLAKNRRYNQLRYMTETKGKELAGIVKKSRDPKVAAQKATNQRTAFGKWAKKHKESGSAVLDLLKTVLKFVTKDGAELTSKGKKWAKAAGVQMAD